VEKTSITRKIRKAEKDRQSSSRGKAPARWENAEAKDSFGVHRLKGGGSVRTSQKFLCFTNHEERALHSRNAFQEKLRRRGRGQREGGRRASQQAPRTLLREPSYAFKVSVAKR